jgi:hypothetical protein
MAFTRSGTSEYAGARFTGRLTTDPAGTLQPSVELKAGEGNYVKVDGIGRNRWGDYMGIARDPANANNLGIFVEYAETPVGLSSRWGTWAGIVSFSTQSACILCGDVSADGVVNSTDALIILSCELGVACPPNFKAECGDVNLDNVTNSTDALIILTCDVGLPQCPSNVGKPGGCR